MPNPSERQQAPFWDESRRKLARLAGTCLALAAVLLIVLVFVTSCAVPEETTSTGTPTAPAKSSSAPKPKPPAKDPNKADISAIGAEFTVGSGSFASGRYTVVKGWTVRAEYGVPMFTGKVKNVDDGKNALPNLQIKFMQGSELVMSFTCTANELEPGQTTKLNCFSTDEYTKKFDKITAETGLS